MLLRPFKTWLGVVAMVGAGVLPGSASAAADAVNAPQVKLADVPTQIVARQPFTVRLEATNRNAAVQYVRVVFPLPTSLLLAAPPGPDCFAQFDAEGRQLLYEGPAPADWRATCSLQLVALPSASTHASFSVRLFAPPEYYTGDVATATIDTPPDAAAVSLGGVGITPMGIAVLGFLGLGLLLTLVGLVRAGRRPASPKAMFSARQQALGGAFVLTLCLGFLSYFAWMAHGDWRTLTAFQETRCDVLDGNVRHVGTSSASQRSGQRTRDPAAEKSRKPVFSLRYEALGQTRQALGFSTDSRLSYTAAEVAQIIGDAQQAGRVPCWFDPQAPQQVVLLRGFGGAYLFALIPLAALVLFGWLALGRQGR